MTIKLKKRATEESTFSIVVSFLDEDEESLAPNSVNWNLTTLDGTVINSQLNQEETAASSITITMSGEDLKLLPSESGEEYVRRLVTIRAKYNSDVGDNLDLVDDIEFEIKANVLIPYVHKVSVYDSVGVSESVTISLP